MGDLNDILNRCVVGPQDGRELTVGEATIVLELAEIGRLAVEERQVRDVFWKVMTIEADVALAGAVGKKADAVDAFLAKHAANNKETGND